MTTGQPGWWPCPAGLAKAAFLRDHNFISLSGSGFQTCKYPAKNIFFCRKHRTQAVNIRSKGSLKDRRGVYCTQEDSEMLHRSILLINKNYFKIQQQWKTVRNGLLNMITLQTAKFPWWRTHSINGHEPTRQECNLSGFQLSPGHRNGGSESRSAFLANCDANSAS